MPTSRYEVRAVEPFPIVGSGDKLAELLTATLHTQPLRDGDAVVIASKVVSIEENRHVDLRAVQPSAEAEHLSAQTGKDARVVQLILDESASYRLATHTGPIIAWHHNGYELTSAGVDRDSSGGAYLLPADPDASARRLRRELSERTGTDVAVIIADSDGRPDRRGATVLAVGAAGLTPLRVTTTDAGKVQEETLADMLAAAAGVVLGQRGRGAPIAVIRGVDYQASDDGLRAILHR